MYKDKKFSIRPVEEVLREDVADAGSDPWNSTLAYAYDDTVFHGYLYAVPDGVGIEFDKNSYLWDAENPIYSRTAAGGHFGREDFPWENVEHMSDLAAYIV